MALTAQKSSFGQYSGTVNFGKCGNLLPVDDSHDRLVAEVADLGFGVLGKEWCDHGIVAGQPQPPKEEFTAKDQIAVLSKEYDTLRAEIIARTNNGYQLWGSGAIAIAWLAGRPKIWSFWLLASVFGLIFLGILGALYRDMSALCRRVSAIENMVNDLAGGKELLEWETRWGGASPNGWLCLKRDRK